MPPISKDALVHHLALPKLYLKHGGIYEIPFMEFSYYPMNLDLLYMVPLYFGNDIIPKLIHFSFGLLTAWLIFGYLRRRLNRTYALFGAVFFLSVPIVVKLSITVYVDLGLVFFSTAALLLHLKWIESRFRPNLLILSAVCCGLAMGTKYNGLITFLLLGLFTPFAYSRYAQGAKPGFLKACGHGLLFMGIALLVFSPWMVKNYLLSNNPIYPLYDHWFNPQQEVSGGSVGVFSYRALIYGETWWKIAGLPLRVFFQGQDGNPQYFDGKLNPFLFALPLVALYPNKKEPERLRNEKKSLMVFAGLYFLFAFFRSDVRVRYISPFIPPLVILSTCGVSNLFAMVRKWRSPLHRRIGGVAVFSVIFFSLWLNAKYIYGQYEYVKPFQYLKGTLSRDEYIDMYRPEYPAMRYINEHLPSNARVLFIFLGKRGYYCDRAYIFDMIRNRSTLRQLVKSSDGPEGVFLRLREMGISHLLINYDIFERWRRANFAEEDRQLLVNFLKEHSKLLFLKWGYGVSRLENPSLQ